MSNAPKLNNNNSKDTERQVSIFLLTVLQVIINEQVRAKLLDHGVGKYIYDALRDQCKQMGYLK